MGFLFRILPVLGLLLTVFPSRGKDFPAEAFRDSAHWKVPEFRDSFLPRETGSVLSHRRWPDPGPVFGVQPHAITAKFENGEMISLTILFLDSGTHFGYVPRDRAKANEKANRENFRVHFEAVKAAVTGGLNRIGRPGNRPVEIGARRMLKQTVFLFQTGDLVARLHAIDEQLIKVTFFPDLDTARHWISPGVLEMRSRDREEQFARNVNRELNGDVLLRDVPLLPQGDRAYCGVSALSMAMQYLGLAIDTEDYAAAAGIRYGSTRGSHIREVYGEAAEEAGFRLSRTTRFDFEKAKKSIEVGIPVLVWRRWTQERDFVHTMFARRFLRDPTVRLPEPDAADRATWPGKNSYTHCTVITGYNEERREVVFTESWTERERNRRMRIEEMEATAYYTFYLRL